MLTLKPLFYRSNQLSLCTLCPNSVKALMKWKTSPSEAAPRKRAVPRYLSSVMQVFPGRLLVLHCIVWGRNGNSLYCPLYSNFKDAQGRERLEKRREKAKKRLLCQPPVSTYPLACRTEYTSGWKFISVLSAGFALGEMPVKICY